uniref:Uncharacterized protein n=1 Tax=Mustela putorius furo TaxID=9669 RepID=M3XXY3_MUSPF
MFSAVPSGWASGSDSSGPANLACRPRAKSAGCSEPAKQVETPAVSGQKADRMEISPLFLLPSIRCSQRIGESVCVGGGGLPHSQRSREEACTEREQSALPQREHLPPTLPTHHPRPTRRRRGYRAGAKARENRSVPGRTPSSHGRNPEGASDVLSHTGQAHGGPCCPSLLPTSASKQAHDWRWPGKPRGDSSVPRAE